MKSFSKQLQDATTHITLSDAEKSRMREQLVAYMEYKPIRLPKKESKRSPIAGMRVFTPFFKTHHFSGAFLIATLVVGSTFGVTFAADEALPGDLLYPVKVNVTEEVRSVFMNTKESQIAWERERAERRLMEASRLAAEGRLDDENKEAVSKLFAEHTKAVVQHVREIEEQDPIFALEASSDLEESLDAHEAVLARIIVENEGSEAQGARELVEQVRATSMVVEKMREDGEIKIAVEPTVSTEEGSEESEEESGEDLTSQESTQESANMRIRATERSHAQAKDALVSVEKQIALLEVGTELYTQAMTQVTHGKSLMEEGEKALTSYEYGVAYNAFRQAKNSFEKVRLLLEVQKLFSIEIYANDVDEKEVSESEEKVVEELNAQHARIKSEIQEARALLLTRTGHELTAVEKANSLIKDGEARMLQGEIAMVLGDHDSASDLFSRAHTHVSRAVAILEVEDSKSGVETLPTIPTDSNAEDQIQDVETLIIRHSFSAGVHTYSGTVQVPTPCHSIEYTAQVAESYPEQIFLAITTRTPEEEAESCAMVVSEKEFSITVEASVEAKLNDVQHDGSSILFELTEVEVSDDVTDAQDKQQSGGEVYGEPEARAGMFERAFDSTQSFFSR